MSNTESTTKITEIYKDIPNYEGIYQVSNLGNVKSIERNRKGANDVLIKVKERILKARKYKSGYMMLGLSKNSKTKTRLVHQLVAEAFLNHVPNKHISVVNHIDFNRINNNVNNLEIVTMRENSNKKHIETESKYVGVFMDNRGVKWRASIYVNKKAIHLGIFDTEKEASKYYENALNCVINKDFESIIVKKPNFTSNYKGVCYDKNRNKWMAQIKLNGKKKHLGRFANEIDASNAYQNALKEYTDGE